MPIDDRTTNRSYKLPNAGNFLADDVQRLRDALTAIDADVFARYTKTETDQKLADLINGAPGALDTLNELAAAMGNDPNFAATITNALAGKPGFADVWTRTQADARYVQGVTQTENVFTGTGSQTTFTLTQTPPTRESLLVTVDGVVQPTTAYNLSGSALILSEAPASGASIRVLMLGVAGPVQSASTLNFTPAGTGAVTRTVDSKLKDVVSVTDFGAKGDNSSNDTAAINAALAASNVVFFPPGTYLTTGNHNIKGKTIIGASQERSIVKLSGSNTNTSIFVNGESISTSWGSGAGCILQNIKLQGNWDGSTVNTETDISNIGALLKWWSGAYVRVSNCNFSNSFGFGIFCYRLGYSYFNGCEVYTTGKNGIHLQAPSGSDSITSTTINFCSVHSNRGRSAGASTGGTAIYVANGFAVSIYGCVVEDVDDGFRLGGADNRSVCLYYLHSEQCSGYDVYYEGYGTDFGMYQCMLGSTNKFYQPTPQYQAYTAINNFGLADTYELPITQNGPNQVIVDSATPRKTIASVTVGPGTWLLTGNWTGTNASGLGNVSSAQAYAINTSAAIPGYSGSFDAALLNGELTSAANQFNCLSGSLSMLKTVTSNTTFYLYGGPASISSTLACALAGQLRAVKVNGPYL